MRNKIIQSVVISKQQRNVRVALNHFAFFPAAYLFVLFLQTFGRSSTGLRVNIWNRSRLQILPLWWAVKRTGYSLARSVHTRAHIRGTIKISEWVEGSSLVRCSCGAEEAMLNRPTLRTYVRASVWPGGVSQIIYGPSVLVVSPVFVLT